MSKPITIVHLYAKEMNIYGDNGNVLVLQKRLKWRGIDSKVVRVGVGDTLPNEVHLVIGGGGQDAGQQAIAEDLGLKKPALEKLAEKGVPMLMICGMYQMMGEAFITSDNLAIDGIGILDVTTRASNGRLVGNVTSQTDFGALVGYENHSGRSRLGPRVKALGAVPAGVGNNALDKTEGARFNNVFGSYLHGPVLAKSPRFADFLLRLALDVAGEVRELSPLDDSLEFQAAEIAISRPR
jgi:CobQ-like glutamine amidotransferase family enzyme